LQAVELGVLKVTVQAVAAVLVVTERLMVLLAVEGPLNLRLRLLFQPTTQ
jgi:hypothetical protein